MMTELWVPASEVVVIRALGGAGARVPVHFLCSIPVAPLRAILFGRGVSRGEREVLAGKNNPTLSHVIIHMSAVGGE
jgi:hypothetical protein